MHAARTAERTTVRVGGASLALVGLMMLSLVFVEFRWVGTVLAMRRHSYSSRPGQRRALNPDGLASHRRACSEGVPP